MDITGVFDIECGNWIDFTVGGLWTKHGFTYERSERDYFNKILSIEGTLWGHNAGKYDTLWFLSMMKKQEIRRFAATLQGSRVLRLRVGKLQLQDSFALIPMSLNKAGGIVGSGKMELPFPYSDIHPNMSARKFKILVEYLEQDCRLLWDVLHYIKDYSEQNGIDLRATVGASAWRTAQQELDIKQEVWRKQQTWKFARAGYYGGRCEVFKTVSPSGLRYDRNSSYPAALVETPLPTGPKGHWNGKKASIAYTRDYEGIYSATVSIPEMMFPPLPHRVTDVHGAGRLMFPVGEIHGTWAANELRYAESCGVKIKHIAGGVVWMQRKAVLRPWCQRMWSLRQASETQSLGQWLKWLMNSLTGKLGEKADKNVLVQLQPGELPRGCNGAKYAHETGLCPSTHCCNHRCIGECGAVRALDPDLNLWERSIWYIPKNSYPHWAAYLTASARISLHRKLMEAGEHAVYCDTDSTYSERELRRDIGPGLGEWKLEGLFEQWQSLAPKLYRYSDGKDVFVRGKGFPGLDDNGFRQLTEGETIDLGEMPNTFKLGIKSGDGIWSKRWVLKTCHLIDGLVGARGLLDDGTTCPLTEQEFAQRMKGKRP